MTRIAIIAADATPVDVVDGYVLSVGSYVMQNKGPAVLSYSDSDSAISDPSTLVEGHTLLPGQYIGFSVEAGPSAFYLWSAGNLRVPISDV